MSEYQYYEFLGVDRPLTQREMAELRGISSRAKITTTHFVNEYHFGDLSADPVRLMARYFDVFVYLANWGTRRFALRIPEALISLETLTAYCGSAVSQSGPHLVVDLRSTYEGGEGWVDPRGWMQPLTGVRALLLQGDLRPLYLIWLLRLQDEEDEYFEDTVEPPVPPGLGELPEALTELMDFLRINPHLVEVAAEESAPLVPPRTGLLEWIAVLPEAQKDLLLLQVAQGEHAQAAATLAQGFHAETATGPRDARRTWGTLRARAEQREAQFMREHARLAAEAKQVREAKQAAARAKHLRSLAPQKAALWDTVERLIKLRAPRGYKGAVETLVELRDLARLEADEGFQDRLLGLREAHARKVNLIRRLDKAGLR